MEKISIKKHYIEMPYNAVDLTDETIRYSLNIDDVYLNHIIVDYLTSEFNLKHFKNVKLDANVNIYSIIYINVKNVCQIKASINVMVYINNQEFHSVVINKTFENIKLYIEYKEHSNNEKI